MVGAIIAGNLWQKNGGKVKVLFAFDGWGVPLIADFPCYRLSHDYFTHTTSKLLGGDKNAFYASLRFLILNCGDLLKMCRVGGKSNWALNKKVI